MRNKKTLIGMRCGSKADNIRLYAQSPQYAHWNRKSIREIGTANWKARRANLQGRPHPSDSMEWTDWLIITENRRIERENRNR